jgi:hypothetical protein
MPKQASPSIPGRSVIDCFAVSSLHSMGRTKVIYETRGLARVNGAIAEVLAGEAKARLVLQP